MMKKMAMERKGAKRMNWRRKLALEMIKMKLFRFITHHKPKIVVKNDTSH
jgi:hypothetical protein